MSDDEDVKTEAADESMDEDDDGPSDQMAFSPAALGLHRVGTKLPKRAIPSQPMQVLNARGMPARIRRKNKLFFDVGLVNEKPKNSPKRGAKSPIKTPSKVLKRRKVISRYMNKGGEDDGIEYEDESDLDGNTNEDDDETFKTVEERKTRQRQKIGLRLKNLLKLPKAHKFVSYEWFYSNIDQALFNGENDFQACLRESFPQLKTRLLSRIEWTKIRRIMGKPRRCSQAYFEEERRELERKRQKIRLLQTRKIGDVSFVKDLPREIPLPLAIGTKVTARLREPQDGLFTGVVAAVEPANSHYRVTFDRPGLGTLSVPDFELLAFTQNETIPLSSITQNFRNQKPLRSLIASPLCQLTSSRMDPILGGGDGMESKMLKDSKVTVAGHPLKLIELIVRTKKILAAKEAKLLLLQKLNSDVAINKSYDEPITDEDQKQYASLVVNLEKVNREVQSNLSQMQYYSRYLSTESNVASLIQPTYLREKCREMGVESMQKHNLGTITDEKTLGLISDLGMIMWVVSHLTNNDQYGHVLRVLEGCIEEVKSHLDEENIDVFNKTVMVHIHHLKIGLSEQLQSSTSAAAKGQGEELGVVAIDH